MRTRSVQMIAPKKPRVLVILLLVLSITSGKRWVDFFIMSREEDAGVIIGSMN